MPHSDQTHTDSAPTPAATGPGVPGVFQRLDLTSSAPYPRSWYPRKFAWAIVWRTLFRLSPRPFSRFRVMLLNLFGAQVHPSANIRPSARIWHPWIFTMRANSCLADGVTVYNLGPVYVGEHTVISQDSYVCAGTHDYTKPNLPLERPPIYIGRGVWVCAQAFIGPGVTVGDNALVGARAVVTRDVPPGMMVAGNPAKIVRQRPLPPDAIGATTNEDRP